MRSLSIIANGMELHHGGVGGQLCGRLDALEDLEMPSIDMQLHDVAVLATLPGLRRLYAWEVSGSPDAFAKLVK